MNFLTIFSDNIAIVATSALMSFALFRTIKRTRKVVRIEEETEEQRKAKEIAKWLDSLKNDSTTR